jgi:glucose dehydrogenase
MTPISQAWIRTKENPLSTPNLRLDSIAYVLLALAVVAGCTGLAKAQGIANTIPAHALPENAHLDFSRNDWDCYQPYRRRQSTCALGRP